MIAVDVELLRTLVAEARLAPSVHNIQPTRWRIADGRIVVLADAARTLPVADPSGHDVAISHGAAIEGLSLALAARGLRIAETAQPENADEVARLTIVANGARDPLSSAVATRISWRGKFTKPAPDAAARLDRIAAACCDLTLIRTQSAIADAAKLGDAAGLHFLRDPAHRAELLHWMRLSSSHPDFLRDGLGAPQMALSRFEAVGAGLALGPLFSALDRICLAAPLVAEGGKTRSATALALFCRPHGEDPLVSGRHFYRAWLAIAREGFQACVMSVLADLPAANAALRARHGVGDDKRLVSVMRIGAPVAPTMPPRVRLPAVELIA